MKRLFAIALTVIAGVLFLVQPPALAADLAVGAKVFASNCAACHAGGANIVQANKTLKKEDLQKYGMDSKEAIINQATKGKNAMPAFGGRLTDEQLEAVAEYVLDKAENGWS